jgi:hypothetical protein
MQKLANNLVEAMLALANAPGEDIDKASALQAILDIKDPKRESLTVIQCLIDMEEVDRTLESDRNRPMSV